MNKMLEIGAYVLASAVALGGGFVGAELAFSDGEAQPERAAAERPGANAPTEGVELRNARYGFRFRHPESWQVLPFNYPNVANVVGRADGALCMVTVTEQRIPSDSSGKPEQLGRMLAEVKSSHLQQAIPAAAGAQISSFEKAELGGQEARSFALEATIQQRMAMKVIGHVTLRSFGAVVLMCLATDSMHRRDDVQKAFQLVHASFRFE